MTSTAEELKKYELMLIISGELPEAEFEKELTEIRKTLQENTKGISHEDMWGRKDMAYRVKKQWRGYYTVFDFTAAPESIAELRTNMKLNPVVLRYLLISLPEDYDPAKYKDYMLPQAKSSEETRKYASKLSSAPRAAKAAETAMPKEALKKPTVAGKEEEEQLKTVEKKLEQILENPDIDIK
ncbi:30S ribosomal protein S6 [Candidatus Peregrinibacteria bacterium]|nr:30S ribosomal protein S6 [Candidatus Peregrinibacteria bacterium]